MAFLLSVLSTAGMQRRVILSSAGAALAWGMSSVHSVAAAQPLQVRRLLALSSFDH
jgi:hypothetical protein